MSARTFTVVCCDGCGEFYPQETLPTETATQTRAALRLDGWAVSLPGGKDYCACCKPGAHTEETP